MKYYLKSFTIGFEVPFFDSADQTGIAELQKAITESYLHYFNTIKSEIHIVEMSTGSTLLVYSLIVRIDTDLINPDEYQTDWTIMKSRGQKALESFLSARNLEYRILTEMK